MSQNICDCPNPPGGRVYCGPEQIAICRVKDGQLESFCLDVPRTETGQLMSVSSALRNRNFARNLEEALGVESAGFGNNVNLLKMALLEGHYISMRGGETASVRLPEDMKF